MGELFLDGTVTLLAGIATTQMERMVGGAGYQCFATVMLPGYHPVKGFIHDGDVIVLHRLGPGEGNSISYTMLNAQPKAKKAYDAGEVANYKRKWKQADGDLRAAVATLPSIRNGLE